MAWVGSSAAVREALKRVDQTKCCYLGMSQGTFPNTSELWHGHLLSVEKVALLGSSCLPAPHRGLTVEGKAIQVSSSSHSHGEFRIPIRCFDPCSLCTKMVLRSTADPISSQHCHCWGWASTIRAPRLSAELPVPNLARHCSTSGSSGSSASHVLVGLSRWEPMYVFCSALRQASVGIWSEKKNLLSKL